jgi:subtilisin family serine protease
MNGRRPLFTGLVAVAVAALAAGTAAAFTPTDPLAAKQWYLAQDHAFDLWPDPPAQTLFTPVKVAIVDSGIDAGHPDFAGRIVAGRSFVGGDWRTDQQGHGTFVAGMIGANLDGQGIAGIAYESAQLIIAKVVRQDGTIPLSAEAAAIRWSADQGARVINLSLGGVRDPRMPVRDTFSRTEADAVAYAYQKGAVLVAAVGNGDEAPTTPWPYASYPAALPHVIGVSALSRAGAVPAFSNRDRIYNDIAAPGQDMFSTMPRDLTALRPTCVDQGYSDCGPDDYRRPEGTSFAAPQVAGAAALLIGLDPALRPEQVTALPEQTADDANASNGCHACPLLRDAFTGWGRLDIAKAIAALDGPLPAADHYESNDDAGLHAHTVFGGTGALQATLDFYDDQIDVYRIRLMQGQRIDSKLTGPAGANVDLVLWKPGTQHVDDLRFQRLRAAESAKPGADEQLTYRATTTGWYFVEAKITTPYTGAFPYTLSFAKRP